METTVNIKRKVSRASSEEFSCMLSIGTEFFPLTLKTNDSEFLSFLLKNNAEFCKTGEIELPLLIDRRKFVDDNEKEVEYFSYEFQVEEAVFELRPEARHKRILNYLLEREGV